MSTRHRMVVEDDDGRDVVLACPEAGCGRRVVLRRSGGLAVIDRGDPTALHSGGTPGLAMGPVMLT